MMMSKYVVKNNVSGISNAIHLCRTDAEMSRNVTAEINSVPVEKRTYNLNDFTIFRIGTFDTETLDETILDSPEVVPFDSRYLAEHECTADVKEVVKDINSIR